MLKKGSLERIACIGELSLDGSLRKVNGSLPIALAMRKYSCKTLLLPKENAIEAAIEKDLNIIGITSLDQAVRYINGHEQIESAKKRGANTMSVSQSNVKVIPENIICGMTRITVT